MKRLIPTSVALALVALAIRVQNALRYPPDWGYDATFNWRYIYRLSQDWTLPPLSAGWSTSDPPFFYFVSALALRGLDALGARNAAVWVIPLLSLLAGLGVVALAVALTRRAAPADPLRSVLAGLLLLYLPAHLHMSAMVNEGMLLALLTSAAVYGLALRDTQPGRHPLAGSAAVGLASGLALLTKLSGGLAILTGVATYAADGWRRAQRSRAAARCAVLLLVSLAVGGWFHARVQLATGSLQPFALGPHTSMLELPPGERGVLDYLRVPLATWRDPQLLNPDLLHSVWGSTYVSVWFDGHRFFLPRASSGVTHLGTLTLVLALLPTAAFAVGLMRGSRRWLRGAGEIDLPLLLLTAATLASYVWFTWRNPFFSVVKGSSLLGLSLPYAFYASETLADWLRGRHGRWVAAWLFALAVCVVLSCTFGLVFSKSEVSGLPWPPVATP